MSMRRWETGACIRTCWGCLSHCLLPSLTPGYQSRGESGDHHHPVTLRSAQPHWDKVLVIDPLWGDDPYSSHIGLDVFYHLEFFPNNIEIGWEVSCQNHFKLGFGLQCYIVSSCLSPSWHSFLLQQGSGRDMTAPQQPIRRKDPVVERRPERNNYDLPFELRGQLV